LNHLKIDMIYTLLFITTTIISISIIIIIIIIITVIIILILPHYFYHIIGVGNAVKMMSRSPKRSHVGPIEGQLLNTC
jgi:hypothetical protein